MDFRLADDGRVLLQVNERELLALKSALMETNEAIRDDMAFSARVGVRRDEVEQLFDQVVQARRLFFREGG